MYNDVKFGLIKFSKRWLWSKRLHKKYFSCNIEDQVWETEDMPIEMEILNFTDILKYIKSNPGYNKAERNAVMRILTPRYPLKEQVGIEKWNCTIYADLDMKNSPKISALPNDKQMELFNQLDYALQNICPNNYAYIEHSSSKIGIHCIFYFDCEPTQHNHDKFAQYVYEIFRYKIDEYIKDFSHIYDPTICEHKVWDDVYSRPYQKLYITGIDSIIHNCSGYCEDIDVEVVEKITEKQIKNGTFDVKFITKQRKYNTDYYDRLYIITALKKYVGDYEKCRKLWYQICDEMTLYKNYTIENFKNMLDMNWNKIDEKTGRIEVLRKYGFKIDENNLHIHLKDDEFISDYVEEIVDFCGNGINLLISGTGTGKTEVWKEWWNRISDPVNILNHRSILIIEPMNSIINSKYNNEKFVIVTGSKKIRPDGITKCYITNYNHLLKTKLDEIVEIDNIDKFFEQFELVIVDESHILLKDVFRSDVLIPFMKTLNKITKTKIIIQTATTLFEEAVLNIKKTITIHKNMLKNVKVIYRKVEDDKFNIAQIACLVDYYVKNGKKVYIYWKDGSLNNMKWLQKIYPETIVKYHKRDLGSDDMTYIDENHELNANVLISSVYFGVGNDLNNEIDDAAVIIVGNNIWQEDEQAKGRWRNAKNIEICIILKPNDIKAYNNSKDYKISFGELYDKNKWLYEQLYQDIFNREKSIIIGGKTFMIKDETYIDYLAKIAAANEYSAQICVKNEEFERLGYDVRKEIKPLEYNEQWKEELNKYHEDIKDVRNKIFAKAIHGEYDWENANKDNKTEICVKTLKRLNDENLLQYCDVDKLTAGKILRWRTFLQYYNAAYVYNSDWAELFAILWAKEKIKGCDKEAKFEMMGETLNGDEYYKLCGYLIWLTYRNKEEVNEELAKCDYYMNYCKKVDEFKSLEERLINRIFVKNAYNEAYNEFLKEFLGSEIDTDDIFFNDITRESLFEHIIQVKYDDEKLREIATKLIQYYGDLHRKGKIGGKIAGKIGKKIKVTAKFKNMKKYNLTEGQEFNSCIELAEYVKKTAKTVSEWMKKGWIDEKCSKSVKEND